jgi:hypothetical protein
VYVCRQPSKSNGMMSGESASDGWLGESKLMSIVWHMPFRWCVQSWQSSDVKNNVNNLCVYSCFYLCLRELWATNLTRLTFVLHCVCPSSAHTLTVCGISACVVVGIFACVARMLEICAAWRKKCVSFLRVFVCVCFTSKVSGAQVQDTFMIKLYVV